jgi:Ca2+-binding EF-hand superfamily protein
MATDLQTRKIDASFRHIDADGNGYIERDDLLGLGARLLAGFGLSPASETGNTVVERFDALWRTLVETADADRDGRISPREYRASMIGSFVDGDRFDTVFHPAIKAVVDIIDSDSDGLIDREEFRLFHEAFGRSDEDVEIAFARLDRDGDGRLTDHELLSAARDYYTSADPSAVGNALFGELPAPSP